MTDIEQKALALVNEVRAERGWQPHLTLSQHDCSRTEALCRAIEQHEAFRQEVSDAVEAVIRAYKGGMPHTAPGILSPFILPKPDPLVEAWIEATGNTVGMEPLNEAIEKRGGKIVWGEE